MKVIDFPQGSEEWKAARAGVVTASRMEDVLAKIKTGEAADRRDYKTQLVAEILTGMPQDNGYVSAEMQWGIEHEPFAKGAYEAGRRIFVDRVGLVMHPEIARAGASPDGLVEGNGLIEIKCPKTATHLQYLLAGTVPTKYQPQMLWQMACTEREWCDFVSYDPRLPEHLQLFVVRFHRDDKRIADMTTEVKQLIGEVEQIVAMLRAVQMKKAA